MVICVNLCGSFSLCHPGPCPQCPAFVTKFCICGRTRYSSSFRHVFSRCSELSESYLWGLHITTLIELCLCSQPMRCGQGTVLQCNNVCGALLTCAEHTCTQVCHSGACQPCQLQVQQGESHFHSSPLRSVLTDVNVSFHLGNLVSD